MGCDQSTMSPEYSSLGYPGTRQCEPKNEMERSLRRLVQLCQQITIGEFKFGTTASNENAIGDPVLEFDLLSSETCLADRRTPSPVEMGQKPSTLWSKPKISLTWALKNDISILSSNANGKPSSQDNRSKTVLKPNNLRKNSNLHRQNNDLKQQQQQNKTTPSCSVAAASSGRSPEPKKTDSGVEKRYEEKRSISPTSSTSTSRLGRRRRLRRARPRCAKANSTFGYEIQDVDEFLTKASLDSPGNIPMVLSRPCVLYETHTEGTQREVSLPLGMVVNGVLKNRAWLYAQTPHGEEGYVPYACCLPLGILPAPSRPQPCWDTQTDIFPRPSGNRTDREKLRDETRSECGIRTNANRKRTRRDSGERSFDGLYLRASRKPATRQTLLVIGTDYKSSGSNKLSVCKGDVVSLVSSQLKDWFWVRDRNGMEGFIPAVVAGHGFL